MNKITRRQALGTTAGALTVLGLTAAATGVATSAAATPAASTPQGTVDEVYQGRRIQITPGGAGHHGGHHSPGQPTVRIDGRELHIMRNADGSWISVINHYETFTEPRLLARAAVRDLQGAPLVPFGGAA
ncbi:MULTISPECIES: apotyrosinase chaperone MelC1 [Streptomyces]|uniref:Tyrosinase n=1 Tax=Streptomyces amritsarensis TaxID=681158 RepID=A0ABX3G6Z0_9ACTN|nr:MULTISPECIES: tyrosinase cofactor [Streptomyces]AQT75901.1 tyrosinase [Streptomyces sp. fd1-xmd]MDX6759114.1 tyrosinase cofactor [Streptomyces sp. F8]OLZ71158.1 tyrosinase [Streptomyces amritsarensis]